MSQVVICGAGDWGYLAYWDYCKGSDVLAFVDINNRYKKDIVKTNVQVQSIDYLSTVSKSTQIVVAIENPDERNHAISTMLSLGFSLFKVYSPPVGLNEAEYIKKVSLDRAVSVLKELTDNRSINLSEFLLNETRGGGAVNSIKRVDIHDRRFWNIRLCTPIFRHEKIQLQKIS